MSNTLQPRPADGLSADEKRARLARMLREKAARAAADPGVHRLIEAQVARTPEAVAILHGGRSISYGELNERANRLARRLRTLGVGPDVLVALCLERSAEMIVGLLGVLKAGGAYVPLDPSYPEGRLDYMLRDSEAPVVVTDRALSETLPVGEAKVVRIDSDLEGFADESPKNLDGVTSVDHLAYVIYTSGSTGKPQGGPGSSWSAGELSRIVPADPRDDGS